MGHKKDETEYEIIDVPVAEPVSVENERREAESSSARVTIFKKTMWGFNPKEVNEYIEVLNANLANAKQVF